MLVDKRTRRARFLRWIAAAAVSISVAQAAVEIGDPSPAKDVRLIDGTTLFPMQLRGKVVLTVFWATWCPICMRELPEYQRLRDKYAANGFEVVALSVDEGADEVREYLQRAQLKFPVAMRTPSLKEAWGPVQGTPLVFLSDRDGVIRAKHLGAPEITELESRIKSLLGIEAGTPPQSARASFKRQS